MGRIQMAVNRNTPTVVVHENRSLGVREIAFYRHPDQLDDTQVRITKHHFAPSGILKQSADPRLADAGIANFIYHNDLRGNALHTRSVDAGTSIRLNDTAGRLLLNVNGIQSFASEPEDHSQAASHTWHYEDPTLPGRPLAVSEQVAGDVIRVVQRFVYAAIDASYKNLNLAGLCVEHFDTAGLLATERLALCGVPIAITRQLPKEADNPDREINWHGKDASAWRALLESERYTTLTKSDSKGSVLATQDAAGHRQRLEYDVAGHQACSWLTVNGGAEQPIVVALAYSATEQKLSESHGNGVTCTYAHEPRTQRLTGIKAKRAGGLMQDLRYRLDAVGNVLSVRNEAQQLGIWRNQRVEPESGYGYDSIYQLVNATGREMAGDKRIEHTNYRQQYSYDNAGNLTRIRHVAADSHNSYTTCMTFSNRSNRAVVRSLTENPAAVDALFTARGHQGWMQPGQRLRWTARGELSEVTPVVREGKPDDRENYRYDANSQRALKTDVRMTRGASLRHRVLYLSGLELRMAQADASERESMHVICTSEVTGATVRVLHRPDGTTAGLAASQTRYNYDNLNKSIGLEVDAEGNVISREEYYPHGGTAVWDTRHETEVDLKACRYAGKERDATGLYYYGYRYYQPWAGRWLSADPAGSRDGLNLYCMVHNNPSSSIDANGLDTIKATSLDDFESAERDSLIHAMRQAKNVLKGVLTLGEDLYATEMKSFFGSDYRAQSSTIIDSWQRIDRLLAEYDTPTGHDNFVRLSRPNSTTAAFTRPLNYDGKIYILDSFFDPQLTDDFRTDTIIHEVSHFGEVEGSDIRGPQTVDYFYLDKDQPMQDAFRIVIQGKIAAHEIVDKAKFTYRLGITHNADSTHITPDTLSYAVALFNATPSLRTLLASENADNIAGASVRMASRIPVPGGRSSKRPLSMPKAVHH